MKFLRRFTRLEWLLGLVVVLSGMTFAGCVSYSDAQFSEVPQRPGSVTTEPGPTAPDTNVPGIAATETGTTAASSTSTPSNGGLRADLSPEDVFTVGDLVTVTFSGVQTPPLPHEEQVKGDGNVTLPLIGSLKADGRTPGELQKDIYNLYVPKFYTVSSGFTVTVKPKERVYYVGGEVKAPGPKVYLGKTTVTKAIQTAGDFTDFANKRSVKLIRANGTTVTVNCNKAITEPELDPPVFPGDKIHVKRRIF